MKKFWTGVVVVFVALFAGCYEINEEITINDNGTGTYVTKMDMSALLQMMQSMASEEEIQKSGLNRVIDTVIALKTVLDTAKDVTPEQKRLFEEGTMKMKVDLKQSIFTADVNFPFKSLTDLQALMSGSGTGGLSEVFKQVYERGVYSVLIEGGARVASSALRENLADKVVWFIAPIDEASASLVDILQSLTTAGIWFAIVWLPILLILALALLIVLRGVFEVRRRIPLPARQEPPRAEG